MCKLVGHNARLWLFPELQFGAARNLQPMRECSRLPVRGTAFSATRSGKAHESVGIRSQLAMNESSAEEVQPMNWHAWKNWPSLPHGHHPPSVYLTVTSK